MVKKQAHLQFQLASVQVMLQVMQIALLCFAGCTSSYMATAPERTPADADAAILLAMQVSKSSTPAPTPTPVSEDCENCNGTGKTGDGRTVFTCPVCNGTGKKPKKEISLDVPVAEEPAKIVSDIDISKVLSELSCPAPAPIDYDKIVAATLEKLVETDPAQLGLIAETVKTQLRKELEKKWGELLQSVKDLTARVEAVEAAKSDKSAKPDEPLPPASFINNTVPSDPVVITVYAKQNSPEHVYARDVLAGSVPKNWQISYVFATAGAPFQALYQRKVYQLHGQPTVADFVKAFK